MNRSNITLLTSFLFLACDTDEFPEFQAEDDEVSERDGQINPCASLTPTAIQHSLDLISESLDLTEQYLQATPNSNYSGAGQMSHNALVGARDFIVAQRTAAAALGLPTPYMVHQGVSADSFLEWSKSAHWLTDAVWWATSPPPMTRARRCIWPTSAPSRPRPS